MSEQYAELARRFVRKEWVEPLPRPPADRGRLVGAVEQALRTRARHRAAIRWSSAVGSVAVAAAAALLLAPRLGFAPAGGPAAKRSAEPPAVVATNTGRTLTVLSAVGESDLSTASMVRGMTVEAGVELSAPANADVRIGTERGTALTLEPESRMIVSEAGATQRFTLRRGAVRARVAKLQPGERFLINTSDAEIEVHGTAFRVAVTGERACADGSATQVAVSEGVVTVRSRGEETRLYPGDAWSRPCPAAAAPYPAPRHAVRRAAVRAARVQALAEASLTPPIARHATPLSALDAQNDLFEAGVRAKQDGRLTEAVRLFTWLAWQYPKGPLMESALVQRMKVLAKIDGVAASQAAAEYLARFPGGFARGEARIIAGAAARP